MPFDPSKPYEIGGVQKSPIATAASPSLGPMFSVSAADAPGEEPDGLPPLPTVSAHRNEKFLQSLPTGIASTVRAMADGRAEPPSGFLLKTPFGQHLQSALATYDPSFDVSNVKSRIAMRKAATSGDLGKNVASLNTVAGHLKELYDAVDGLHNSNSPWFNRNIADPFSNQTEDTNMGAVSGLLGAVGVPSDVRYQTALKDFQSARLAASRELTRAFRGAAGNESDVKGYEGLFSEHDAPEAIKEAVRHQVGLLMSRLHAAADQYNRGMGTTANPMQFLTPQNAKMFQELSAANAGAGPQPAASGAAHPSDIDALLKKYGGQ